MAIPRVVGHDDNRPPALLRRVDWELHEPNLAAKRRALCSGQLSLPVWKLAEGKFPPSRQIFRFRSGKRAVVVRHRAIDGGLLLLPASRLQDIFEDRRSEEHTS